LLNTPNPYREIDLLKQAPPKKVKVKPIFEDITPDNSPPKEGRLDPHAGNAGSFLAISSVTITSPSEASERSTEEPFSETRGECCCPTYPMCLGDLVARDFKALADKLARVELAYERLGDPTLRNRADAEWVGAYVTCSTVEKKCDELLHRALGKQAVALYHFKDLARNYSGKFATLFERQK